MKKLNIFLVALTMLLMASCGQKEKSKTVSADEKSAAKIESPTLKMTTTIPKSIITPDEVKTSIGSLEFFDGVPTNKTTASVYDYLDRARAVQVFLDAMPVVSMYQCIQGQADAGAKECNEVHLYEKLMDSKTMLLTGNTSTMYMFAALDLKKDGPTVIELPPGMLGVLDDAAFDYMVDLGIAGPDKGKGGKYLVLPPGYEGDIPSGYFVVKSKTYRVWNFMRGYLDKGIEAAANNFKDNLKVYPLNKKENPPKMKFINASGMEGVNTVLPNDYTFYEALNEVIQREPIGFLNPETTGLIASIGIIKGKAFNPDARMKKILVDAAAIGNASARAITFYPRDPGQPTYKDGNSAWLNVWADKNTTYLREGARLLDARAWFHYNCIVVSPAMAVTVAGKGSDYTIGGLDSNHKPLDGSKTYKLHLPPNPPAKDFWAITIYDTQTRSQLQTDQQYPTVGSQDKGIKQNADGSYDIYFSPEAPVGMEGNWLQTVPGKSWLIALRMYGPLQPWIDQTWRPGEIELVK